jgi:recombination protein RecA
MSGSLTGALPQGRMVALGGHSSSGKSLVGASIVAEVINQGGYGVIIDSEGAMDEGYLLGVGLDIESKNFKRFGTPLISQCGLVVNKFIKKYRDDELTEKAVILIDSLDMLFTDGESKAIDKEGILKGDQGQRAKQLKRMLMMWVHKISKLNITIVCTKQVYVEQDDKVAFNEPWVFTEALKYAFSQIIIFEKLVFKVEEGKVKVDKGFTMKARSYKNRIAKEKQVVKIEVPFDLGLDPYAGILEIAEQFKVITKGGSWITCGKEKRQGKIKAEADKEFMQMILDECLKVDSKSMEVHADLSDYTAESDDPSIVDEPDVMKSAKAKRQAKAKELQDAKD